LRADRSRLERVTREASGHKAEAETRLQMIEATASRGASAAETERALARLGQMRDYAPLALEAERVEREVRAQLNTEPEQAASTKAPRNNPGAEQHPGG
ncbi:MAG: hypothetical protein ACRD68_16640, partial [Pyrinomonadaceae bacterium]